MEKKKISDYTIYCTEEQVEKALELGAPIESYPIMFAPHDVPRYEKQISKGWVAFPCPTAEQMIGWIEEQKIFVHIAPCVNINCNEHIASNDIKMCKTRKDITLTAIDAALEYLLNNKNGSENND